MPMSATFRAQDVVHAVARHGDLVALSTGSACTIDRFCCGVTRPNTAAPSSSRASLEILGQLAGVDARLRVRNPYATGAIADTVSGL
jgi:hypothetical protein